MTLFWRKMADAQALPPIVPRFTQDTGVALLTSAFGGRIEFLPTRPLHHNTGVLGHAQTDAVRVVSSTAPPLSCSLTPSSIRFCHTLTHLSHLTAVACLPLSHPSQLLALCFWSPVSSPSCLVSARSAVLVFTPFTPLFYNWPLLPLSPLLLDDFINPSTSLSIIPTCSL